MRKCAWCHSCLDPGPGGPTYLSDPMNELSVASGFPRPLLMSHCLLSSPGPSPSPSLHVPVSWFSHTAACPMLWLTMNNCFYIFLVFVLSHWLTCDFPCGMSPSPPVLELSHSVVLCSTAGSLLGFPARPPACQALSVVLRRF